jgi:Flp pilus assembly protein CpaB
MKKVVILLFVLFHSACSSVSECENLEEKISALEAQLRIQQETISNLESERDELQSKCIQSVYQSTQVPLDLDHVYILLAVKDFKAGEMIPMDGVIVTVFPIDLVIEPYIFGTDYEDLFNEVVGCKVLADIPRGMILISNLVDCP